MTFTANLKTYYRPFIFYVCRQGAVFSGRLTMNFMCRLSTRDLKYIQYNTTQCPMLKICVNLQKKQFAIRSQLDITKCAILFWCQQQSVFRPIGARFVRTFGFQHWTSCQSYPIDQWVPWLIIMSQWFLWYHGLFFPRVNSRNRHAN